MTPAHVNAPAWIWGAFLVLILLVLSVDNLLVHGKAHRVGLREALAWSGLWIGLAVAFAIGLVFWDQAGPAVAGKFAAGYLLELSLSVDNLFVFLLIFSHFKVPEEFHHKVLSWGIYGAMIMRAVFIGVGAAAVQRWHWILYLFGAFLVYTGWKMLFHKGAESDPAHSPIARLARRCFRITDAYEGERFLVRKDGRLWGTPLLLVVGIVEATDLVFAVDSIPAVFGVTQDPFIIYTSNVFAILGLRSLFFALEGVMHMFRYLKVGLSVILMLIGLKLLFLHWAEQRFGFQAGEFWVLGLIAGILALSVVASLVKERGSGA